MSEPAGDVRKSVGPAGTGRGDGRLRFCCVSGARLRREWGRMGLPSEDPARLGALGRGSQAKPANGDAGSVDGPPGGGGGGVSCG